MVTILLFSDSLDAIPSYTHGGVKATNLEEACKNAMVGFGVQNVVYVLQLDETDDLSPAMQKHMVDVANNNHDFRVLLGVAIRAARPS